MRTRILVYSLLLSFAAAISFLTVRRTAGASAPMAWSMAITTSPSSYVDSAGQSWVADAYFTGGHTATRANRIAGALTPGRAAVSGASDAVVYDNERWGMSSYNIPVPVAGIYLVRLHEAETWFTSQPCAGKRVFSVTAQGATILPNLDICAAVGPNRAYVLDAAVPVNNGTLNLGFAASTNNAKVDGIQVILEQQLATATDPPPTTSPTTTATPTTTAVPTPTTPPPTTPTGSTPTSPCSGVVVTPGQDIQAAIDNNPSGATICLQPGTYRLSSALSPRDGDTLDGAGRQAILNGAQVVSGWQPSGLSWVASGYLPAPYTDPNYDPCEDTTNNPCKLDEWLFRDNVHLVRATSAAAVVSGTFYADYSANKIYVGDDPSGHTLELSSAREAIEVTVPNVTIQNLVVEKFASPAQRGAVVANADSTTISNDDLRFNHGAGLYDYGNNLHVVGSHIHDNGMLGIGTNAVTGTVVTGSELDHNNTDGFWINDGENGGFKSTHAATEDVENNKVHDNTGMGLWFDESDSNDTIKGNTITNNAADGIRYEISAQATIENNIVTGNGHNRGRTQDGPDNLYYGAGINDSNAQNVEIAFNTVSGNDNGIGLVEQDRGGPNLTGTNVHDNTITMTSGVTGLQQSVGDDSYFTTQGNRFSHDTYHLSPVSGSLFSWLDQTVDSPTWVADGQDTTGTFGP
jgi:parallel beta-helix repeat protein